MLSERLDSGSPQLASHISAVLGMESAGREEGFRARVASLPKSVNAWKRGKERS